MHKMDGQKRAFVVASMVAVFLMTAMIVPMAGCSTKAAGDGGEKCGECGSHDVVPIVYGLPGPELIEQAEAGEVVLGGCVVEDGSPVWHCNGCGYEWGRFGDTHMDI